jgi:hypothetical protein
MRKGKIDKLLEEINLLNDNCKYPSMGYMYYANIAGDGRNYRTVYVITNSNGGVTAVHNGKNPKETVKNLEAIRDNFKAKA